MVWCATIAGKAGGSTPSFKKQVMSKIEQRILIVRNYSG